MQSINFCNYILVEFIICLLLFIIINYFLFPFNFIFYVIKDINNFNIILKYE